MNDEKGAFVLGEEVKLYHPSRTIRVRISGIYYDVPELGVTLYQVSDQNDRHQWYVTQDFLGKV